MGTPDIAATCLKKILADGFEVVGVYTQPDRPKGRGMKLVASPVKEVALAHNIPVFQPENFRADEDVQTLADLKPDGCAEVAYGRLLPQRVADIPTKGSSSSRASVVRRWSVPSAARRRLQTTTRSWRPSGRAYTTQKWRRVRRTTATGRHTSTLTAKRFPPSLRRRDRAEHFTKEA